MANDSLLAPPCGNSRYLLKAWDCFAYVGLVHVVSLSRVINNCIVRAMTSTDYSTWRHFRFRCTSHVTRRQFRCRCLIYGRRRAVVLSSDNNEHGVADVECPYSQSRDQPLHPQAPPEQGMGHSEWPMTQVTHSPGPSPHILAQALHRFIDYPALHLDIVYVHTHL